MLNGETVPWRKPWAEAQQIPELGAFENAEGYYATLFHEMTHSTGHESRLARANSVNSASFGSPAYAKEELTAEMGATHLCGHAGIENLVIENSAAYINELAGSPATG